MRRIAILTALSAGLLIPRVADAFCGFYVNGAGGEMFNDATQVTLMRMGTRTVLSMQNNYKGPAEAFALVIPVPVVLKEDDVKTLPKEVFGKVDTMGAPRLVEYWEQDPCWEEPAYEADMAMAAPPSAGAAPEPTKKGDDLGVKIEAQFTVGEYQIVILSAKDSSGLDTWLRQEKYQIPPGAEPLLRPYVAAGSKFFVAKVDPKKVKFGDGGRAELSPLRFHYDADEFSLPIRLGLANSSGTQDLIVNIMAPNQRYEVANYKNVTIPTNLDVKDDVRKRFGEFYAALYDRTVEKNPGAVVTEYSWQATSCDPCPGPQLDYHDLATLGSDVLGGDKGKAEPYQGYDFVFTRLHARYGKSITDDLVFKSADPIVGGREFVVGDNGRLEEGARKDSMNNFQGRYAIRHEWTGPIKCDKPIRNRWGGPPSGVASEGVKPALDLAFAPRGQAKLAEMVRKDIPEIDVKAAGAAPTAGTPTGSPATPDNPSGTEYKPTKKGGCGCAADDGGAGFAVLGLAMLVGITPEAAVSRRLAIAATLIATSLALPRAADAFCGFYVNGAGGEMYNDATQVTLMRMGTRTVLSMQNNYKGPAEAFALVIPVPVVLHEGDVKTLGKEVFAKVDTMGAPRLVEYWEQDPCNMNADDAMDPRVAAGSGAMMRPSETLEEGKMGVKVEARFTVGEYQIVILSAKDSSGLDAWLRSEKYQIPAGAEPLLRPYVAAGSKFFVAKVDPKKVKFGDDGRAELSPLRFHYDAEEFSLPIRLGLANSSGTQDLIVNILAPHQRYEVTNYKNVTIPTNLDVKDEVRKRFGEFYAALFDRTVEKNPGAVVTEYAWEATTCDPCPGPQLDYADFATLGADVLAGDKGNFQPYTNADFVLTRLHARYGTSITDDLVFKTADPIVGGREFAVDDKGKLEEGAKKDSINNFQGRYAIRHEWTGALACDKPQRGIWGGPPAGIASEGVKPALDLAFAPRGQAKLAELVRRDIPEIDVKAAGAGASATTPATPGQPTGNQYKPTKKGGCGCATGGGAGGWLLGLAVLGIITRRKMRS